MRIEYERACLEAGLPEEKIREIRRMFDGDYKRMKREIQDRENAQYVLYSLELLMDPENGACYFDIPDPSLDLEKQLLHRLDLERLEEVLESISKEERQFILDCFDAERGARKEIAEKYGMTLGAVKQRKRRILEKIRGRFLEE